MALVLRRRRARRRLAAIAFLSDISLEGSNRNSNLRPIIKCEGTKDSRKNRLYKEKQDRDLDSCDEDFNSGEYSIITSSS